MTSSAHDVRYGHAINKEPHEELEDVVRRALALIHGTQVLTAREPREDEVVYRAEAAMGYTRGNRPIYAYVGDIHPQLGVVGLVIERAWPVQEVSRCDTGGLISGKGYFAAVEEESREQALQELTLSSSTSDWEAAFAEETAQVHGGVEHYISGMCPEPGQFPGGDVRARCVARGRTSGDSPIDRRCWTWEVRGAAPPRKEAYLAILLSVTAQEKYAQLLDLDPSLMVVDVPIVPAEDDPSGLEGRWCRPEVLYRWMSGEEGDIT